MGDRVSIQFKQDREKSLVLFSHWDGISFVDRANDYVKALKRKKFAMNGPLARFEPEAVLIDFIRHITKDLKRVEGNYYLGATENDGDNSDNGHFVIKLPSYSIELSPERWAKP